MLVALVTFGVICHAQMGRPDATDVKSCDTEFAICHALLGAFGAQGAKDVARLAAITPSSKSNGARHIRTPPSGLRMRDCDHRQPASCRADCARRREHERHGAAGRRRAVSRVDRNRLRS